MIRSPMYSRINIYVVPSNNYKHVNRTFKNGTLKRLNNEPILYVCILIFISLPYNFVVCLFV